MSRFFCFQRESEQESCFLVGGGVTLNSVKILFNFGGSGCSFVTLG